MTWEGRGVFEVSSADPDSATPVWVDLTIYVNDVVMPPSLDTGRQNDLDQSEPSTLQLVLNNGDDRFTFGNPLSPYFSWWGPGRKCRYREVIAGTDVPLFVGYLQVPTEGLTTAGVEQRVAVSAVDRLARLDSAPAFVSTLAAHIAGVSRGSLVGYWPLLDQAQPFTALVGPEPAEVVIATGSLNPAEVKPSVVPGGGDALPGDDADPVRLIIGTNAGVDSWSPYLSTLTYPNGAPLAAGKVATAVVWAKMDVSGDAQAGALSFATDDGVIFLSRHPTSLGGDWYLSSPIGSLTGTVSSGVPVGSDHYYIFGIRYGYSPNVMEMWIDDRVYTATLSGSFAGPTRVYGLQAGPAIRGSVAHLQLYVGDASDYTHAAFLTQRDVGLNALERQTTGDRIRSVLQYAGVPGAEYAGTVDKGQSAMRAAFLAGQTPLQAMRDAERTEQGLLYVDGSGNLVFKDRRTLYNI